MAAESGRDTVKSCVWFRFRSEMFRQISTNMIAGISGLLAPDEDTPSRLDE
jgi:hypothetical protein